jgi:hypothetical protein
MQTSPANLSTMTVAAQELSRALHVSLFGKKSLVATAANYAKNLTEVEPSSQERGRPKAPS